MSIKDIVYISLFTSITIALGALPPILLPFSPVPITSQSLGPMLCGSILGAKKGGLSSLLFIILVIIGFPILSGGRGGGIGVLLGPAGGFLICWPISAVIIGYFFEKNWINIGYIKAFIIIFFGGMIIIYISGIIWLSIMAGISMYQALISVIIFIPGDLLKVTIATMVAINIKKYYPIIFVNHLENK